MGKGLEEQEAIIVVDLSNGDSGKGTTTESVAQKKRAHTVIRFNGGAQAGHTVVTSDGRRHTFSQFSSATFIPGVETHLSRFMILSPFALLEEEEHLRRNGMDDAFTRMTISEEALVITPFHSAANRLRELARGNGRHGSCGVGVGETVSDSIQFPKEAIHAKDFRHKDILTRKLRAIQSRKREELKDAIDFSRKNPIAEYEIKILEMSNVVNVIAERFVALAEQVRIIEDGYLSKILRRPGCVVFEGAQGVLLDEWRGFHPYTTWSTCTFDNANELLSEHGYTGSIFKLGVVRAYATRHGPGPFVTEDIELTRFLPDSINTMNQWQREFRVGWFDIPATRYAIEACGGVDALAVTCLDRLKDIQEWNVCTSYRIPEVDRVHAKDFFNLTTDSEHLVSGIKLGPWQDLEYQSFLTEHLMQAKPVYEISTNSVDVHERYRQHLNRLSRELGVPIAISSQGSRAKDKTHWLSRSSQYAL